MAQTRKRAVLLKARNFFLNEKLSITYQFINYHKIIFTNTDVIVLKAFNSFLTLSHSTTQLFY